MRSSVRRYSWGIGHLSDRPHAAWKLDRAGRDGVYPDALGCERQPLPHRVIDERRLDRSVGQRTRHRPQAGNRRDVDDDATPRFLHERYGCPGGAHRRHQVDVDAGQPAALVVRHADARRVVDHDVDAIKRASGNDRENGIRPSSPRTTTIAALTFVRRPMPLWVTAALVELLSIRPFPESKGKHRADNQTEQGSQPDKHCILRFCSRAGRPETVRQRSTPLQVGAPPRSGRRDQCRISKTTTRATARRT
jgi:hypothetical protein